jgi:hypothetical protein
MRLVIGKQSGKVGYADRTKGPFAACMGPFVSNPQSV